MKRYFDFKLIRKLKIFLAVFSVLLLFQWPYWVYELYRTIAVVVFSVFALDQFQKDGKKINMLTIFFCICAVLVNPFFKIAMGREMWKFIDLLFAILLTISIVWSDKMDKPQKTID